MKLIVLLVLSNYFHILTSSFVTCSAYYANKGRTRFQYRQRELCLPTTGHERQNYTTRCSDDNKKLTPLRMTVHIFILTFQDRNFFLFRKGIDVSEVSQASATCNLKVWHLRCVRSIVQSCSVCISIYTHSHETQQLYIISSDI